MSKEAEVQSTVAPPKLRGWFHLGRTFGGLGHSGFAGGIGRTARGGVYEHLEGKGSPHPDCQLSNRA